MNSKKKMIRSIPSNVISLDDSRLEPVSSNHDKRAINELLCEAGTMLEENVIIIGDTSEGIYFGKHMNHRDAVYLLQRALNELIRECE